LWGAHTHTNPHANGDAYTNSITNTHREADTDAAAATNTASEAVRVRRR
jgi:hypothetical protein